MKKRCEGEGILLIFDEVITGFRWSLGGAQEYFGVLPDLACFGKSMTNGMPLSAGVVCTASRSEKRLRKRAPR